jgi:DNA polymerase III subunit delta'
LAPSLSACGEAAQNWRLRNHHLWTKIILMSWDLIGHEWAADLLKEHIARDQLRHAYLITGPQGVGRRTLALRLAQAVNCMQPPAPGVPCQDCLSCRQIGRMQHPDLAIVQSEKSAYLFEKKLNPGGSGIPPRQAESKRKRGQKTDQIPELSNQIKIDQIRDLQRTLALTPYQSRYRIALLLQVEDANENTANSLLKTLEEPSSRTILVLTAESAERLPATIVSRCELLRLRPVPIDQLEQALQVKDQISSERASLLAHLAGGRPGYALEMNAQDQILEQRNTWLQDHTRMIGANRVERFDFATSLADLSPKERNTPREILRDLLREQLTVWISLWRDVFLHASGAAVPLTNVDRLDEITTLSNRFGIQVALETIRSIEKTLDLLERNVNARLATEVLMLDLPRW